MPDYLSSCQIDDIIDALPRVDCHTQSKATNRQIKLTKPPGSLGRLEDVAIWLAGWQRKESPSIDHGQCLVFAGNHGVVKQGISLFPAEVTAQMVENFIAGGAAINQLCTLANLKLDVIPIDLENPTNDLSLGPAMTEDEVISAMNIGSDAVRPNCDYLIVGEMGIGNTTSAAALCKGQFGSDASNWVGPGTGLDKKGIALKAKVIETAFAIQTQPPSNVVNLLAAYGGRELAAIAGAVLAARTRSIPVMLDGFASTAAAASLTVNGNLRALDHAMVSHLSAEPGHKKLTVALQKKPLLNLNLRLGEGSGAAVATLLVRAACATHNGMATFDEAGVSGSDT